MEAHNVDELLEQTQWDFFWLPKDAKVVDRPELLYAYCPRDEAFINIATRTRAPAARLPALIDEVKAVHVGRRSRWLVPPTIDVATLQAALTTAGYGRAWVHHGYAVKPVAYHRRPAPGIAVRAVDCTAGLLDWLWVADQVLGEPRARSDEELAAELAACTSRARRVHRFVVYDRDGAPISCGGLNTYPALGIGYLWGGSTVPAARGRGGYSALLAARLHRARQLDLSLVGLLAREGTSAPIVDHLGFSRYGRFEYWDLAV